MVEGALRPGLGIPLEAEGKALSFLPAAGFPPLGMRLAILEVFLAGSTSASLSSLDEGLPWSGAGGEAWGGQGEGRRASSRQQGWEAPIGQSGPQSSEV